jgi:hypothetical protein
MKIMIFKKKSRMVDVRELQRRGVVRIPKEDVVVPTDSNGFVELGATKDAPVEASTESSSNADFFGFGASAPSASAPSGDGYGKREVDEKVVNLDNKIYKLEQRIELLEKKLDVNKPEDSSVGVMGW